MTVRPTRMHRSLPLTVEGDSGLVEGEAFWMDGGTVLFACRERLHPGQTYPVRVDLGAMQAHADVLVTVDCHVQDRRFRRVGFGHEGRYLVRDPDRRAALLKRLRQVNPDLRADPDNAVQDDSTLRPDAGIPRAPANPDLAPDAWSPAPRALCPSVAPTHRLRRQVLPAQVAPGPPVAVFASLAARPAAVRIQDGAVTLTVAAHPALRTDARVALVLQLPDGNIIQTPATVAAVDALSADLVARAMSAADEGLLVRSGAVRPA